VIFRGAVDMKLSENEVQKILKESLQEWNYDGKYIVRHINTKNFKETMIIINLIAGISEAHFHHPDIEFGYKKIKVKLMTHSEDAITQKDLDLAKDIERFLNMFQEKGGSK
jgi:4a-hydroxytetrahydrobiopterin dehydratase